MNATKSILALIILSTCGAMTTAHSAPVDVKVIGTITPASCQAQLDSAGVVDYGIIPSITLSKTDYTVLSEKQLGFNITCEAPAKVAIKATNGRMNTLAGATEGPAGFGNSPVTGLFGDPGSLGVAGLGLADGFPIGGYAMRVDPASVTVDGKSADSIERNGASAWTKAATGSMFSISTPRQNSWADSGTLAPVAFQNLTGKLGVQAYINKASLLDLTHDIQLDGLTSIELIYL